MAQHEGGGGIEAPRRPQLNQRLGVTTSAPEKPAVLHPGLDVARVQPNGGLELRLAALTQS